MAADPGDDTPSLEPFPPPGIDDDHRLAHRMAVPMLRFLHFQAGGGIVMLVATALALVWANSPWQDSYHTLLHSHTRLEFGDLLVLDEQLEEWVNDALMVVFCFLVGLVAPHKSAKAPDARHRRGDRHRLHRVAVHHQPRPRTATDHRPGEDRHPRGVDRRGVGRCHYPLLLSISGRAGAVIPALARTAEPEMAGACVFPTVGSGP